MRQDGSNKISGQEDVSRGCLYAHTPAWKASVLSRVSTSPLVAASHFHSELARDSDADIGKVSLSTGSSVALPRSHPE